MHEVYENELIKIWKSDKIKLHNIMIQLNQNYV